jgi:GNAT superfamily N-acetyltransferase
MIRRCDDRDFDVIRTIINDGAQAYRGIIPTVMGIQAVEDVTLIRHAYVRTDSQKRGLGAKLLAHLRELASGPVLIGTWADAVWALRFYERHGFQLVGAEEKDRLLKRYWTIPDRQIETSVVLADRTWRERRTDGVRH